MSNKCSSCGSVTEMTKYCEACVKRYGFSQESQSFKTYEPEFKKVDINSINTFYLLISLMLFIFNWAIYLVAEEWDWVNYRTEDTFIFVQFLFSITILLSIYLYRNYIRKTQTNTNE